jgi:hypothetical protein
MDELALEKFVDYVYQTPFGGILHLKNGAAIIIRDNDVEILSSLEKYHLKYKDDTSTWNELTNDQDRKKLYRANAAVLTKTTWTDVETVVEAAQKLEAAENRKNLKAQGRALLNDLLTFIVSIPWVIIIIWGVNFSAKRYFGTELSPLQHSLVAGVAIAIALNRAPKNLSAVIVGVVGYFLVALIFWKFG